MELQNMETLLRANRYPGRGVLLGRSADNRHAILAYFIMGRSENSRNRYPHAGAGPRENDGPQPDYLSSCPGI